MSHSTQHNICHFEDESYCWEHITNVFCIVLCITKIMLKLFF